ncbi:MAG: DNA sulfur modification protein DndD [Chloroflexi bacterium]|nr:DNA sulfur modification protein DndD [Chloroflexota bacterium]
MKLERIILNNFRQYFGKQRLDFARDKTKNVTVIHGINGAGKTSLFLALNWCLYGRNVENIKIVDNVGELVSKEAINRANPGEELRASVTISFLHNGDRYTAKRTLTGSKLLTGALALNEMDQFTMMRQGVDGRAEPIMNPLGTMNAILPVNAREYFLFDGEKIDNFAKPEAAAQVKEAIYLVLKLEILDRSKRHLENSAINYRRELKQASGGELRELLEQDEKLRAEREKATARKSELTTEIESAKRKVSEIDQKLRDSQNAKLLQQQRDRVERDLKQRRTELMETVEKIQATATTAYPIVAQPAIQQALTILNAKRERGEIPSSIRQQFVQDLIEQMHCICGRPFAEHGPEHQHLLKLMHNTVPGSLEDDVLDTAAVLTSFADKTTQIKADLDEEMHRRSGLIEFIRDLDAELDDVSRQLKGSPLEEISRLEEQRRNFMADIDGYNLEIGALSQRIEQMGKEINRLEKKITTAKKEERRGRELSTKLELAQKAADAITEMYQVFADNMRTQIEKRTKEIFRTLVWKESHFKDVQLGPDFNLQVIDRYGQQARPELSAGERQVLSLSFITAMARVSEEEAPLVMDTPFGRLSSHHRNSITETLPKLADQLILFVTDEELRDQARQNLNPYIGAEYRLHFDRSTSCTSIDEVKL